MADPCLASIRIFPFNFAPKGWAFCDGQLLPISQNTALYALLGTTYGGDGKSTFALPNFQGNVPIHWGQGPGLSEYVLGQQSGSESLTLIDSEMPAHIHNAQWATQQVNTENPTNAVWTDVAPAGSMGAYSTVAAPTTPMNVMASGITGGNLPHNNMMPTLTLNFCIALQGVFPPRG
jgi:microcystin-dependent protein